MQTINLEGIGEVIIREFDNDDREMVQNVSTEIVSVPIENTNRVKQETKVKIGTMNKYTFILGISKAPFFSTEITAEGVTNEILQKRLIEYKKIDYRIVETIIPKIADINNIDENEFKNLKKNST
jgi:hypothetical protein